MCAEFARLAAQAGVDLSYVRLAERGGQSGRALVAARDAPKGCVLLAVPRCARGGGGAPVTVALKVLVVCVVLLQVSCCQRQQG